MARRRRDYAAEYARRKEIHAGDTYKARGHGSRQEERIEKQAREFLHSTGEWGNHSTAEIKDLAREYGYDVVEEALSLQARAQDAYYDGDMQLAHELWAERNPDLPDWMFHYHGAFGA